MCGIAGILAVWPKQARPRALATPSEQAIPTRWLDTMDAAIAHRGPDGQGRFRARASRADGSVVDVALGHRRLSIIDPAGGHQPMSATVSGGAGGRTQGQRSPLAAIVFNGCVYNHRALRAELASSGHTFQTDHSDTEVLLHACLQWRERVLEHVDAMAAAAVWDPTRAELLLVRDRFGEKPLYVLEAPAPLVRPGESTPEPGPSLYAFASTPAALASLSRELGRHHAPAERARIITEFLALGCTTDRVLIPGVREFPPGIAASIEAAHAAPERERSPLSANTPAAPFTSIDDLRTELAHAVTTRLESDVPLGCFLSGGVDSSLIALLARQHLGSLRTFTVRMPDARLDESAFASQAAKIIGSEHHTIDVAPSPAEDLCTLIAQLGTPFADSSLLPAYWLCKAARQHVTVALGGEGGDELFLGYRRQSAWHRRRMLSVLAFAPESVLQAVPGRRRDELRRLRGALRNGRYLDLLRLFDPAALVEAYPSADETDLDALAQLPWRELDARVYLPHDLMRKADTASMAVALELRSPMLRPALAQRALATPIATLLPGGQRKGLLRALARSHFPADLIDRRKQGFAIPIDDWFRSDFGGLGTMLADHLSPERGTRLFDELGLSSVGVTRLLDEHQRRTRNHGQRLFALLTLAIWFQNL